MEIKTLVVDGGIGFRIFLVNLISGYGSTHFIIDRWQKLLLEEGVNHLIKAFLVLNSFPNCAEITRFTHISFL